MCPPLRSLLPGLILLIPIALRAQSAPVELEQPDMGHHSVLPLATLRVSPSELDGLRKQRGLTSQYLEFEIVVSEKGNVESAEPITQDIPHLSEGRAIEMARHFRPWYRDGEPVRVRTHDYVNIIDTPEYWSTPHVPFPQISDLSQVSINLTRTGCFGSCPVYAVKISGDGSVDFGGGRFVLISGDHTAHIPSFAIRDLLEQFRQADFFSAFGSYHSNWTDLPTHTISLRIGSYAKTVMDYGGLDAGLPMAIRNLEDQIDNTADTARWISGDDNTLPALLADNWDFSASSKENLYLYATAIERNLEALTEQLLTAGAPVLPLAKNGPPLCEASAAGNLSLVQRMMEQIHQEVPSDIRNECLTDAAQTGSLRAVRFWIAHGADPAVQSVQVGRLTLSGPFHAAVAAHQTDVVRELLQYKVGINDFFRSENPLLALVNNEPFGNHYTSAFLQTMDLLVHAGAEVNVRGPRGETPIFAASHFKDQLDLLVHAGANINAQSSTGETALIKFAWYEVAVRNLLAAGADPTLTSTDGKTALSEAQRNRCAACAALIQAALTQRTPSAEK